MKLNFNIDKIFGIIIYCFWTFLIVFGIISLINPMWLVEVNRTDKEREMRYIISRAIRDSQEGKDSLAIEQYKYILTKLPDFPEAYSNMGVSYKKSGDFDKAVYCFNKALRFGTKDSANIFYNLKDIAVIRGDKQDEDLFFVLATKTNYSRIDNLVKQGNYYLNNKSWQKATNAYAKAIEARFDMKNYYRDMVEFAVRVYNKEPKDSSKYKVLYDTKITNDIYKLYDSILFKKIVLKDRGLAFNYNKIGYTLAKMNQFEVALGFFDKALEIIPDYEDAYYNKIFVSNMLNR